jgi:hypothetical protein
MEIPSFLVHFCRGPLEIPHVLNRGGADKKCNGPFFHLVVIGSTVNYLFSVNFEGFLFVLFVSFAYSVCISKYPGRHDLNRMPRLINMSQ